MCIGSFQIIVEKIFMTFPINIKYWPHQNNWHHITEHRKPFRVFSENKNYINWELKMEISKNWQENFLKIYILKILKKLNLFLTTRRWYTYKFWCYYLSLVIKSIINCGWCAGGRNESRGQLLIIGQICLKGSRRTVK